MSAVQTVSWPDAVDEILVGDQAVMLGTVTPAKGVVLAPVTNFATRNRDAGTVSVNSSVGAPRKLERLRGDPHVALAFHTRAHSSTGRGEYVLVQGAASLTEPIPDFPATIGELWERSGPRPKGALWNGWMRIYHLRVSIDVAVQRVLVWPDLACLGTPVVHGAPLPLEPPAPQRPPAHGTAPRIAYRRAARGAARLPHALLGWVGADRLPVVVPVEITGADDRGITLRSPGGLVPAGGRRAGLTSHWFTRHVLGQHQRVMTGWLDADQDGRLHYAPHTHHGYLLPPSLTLYRLAVGLETRRRHRATQRRRRR